MKSRAVCFFFQAIVSLAVLFTATLSWELRAEVDYPIVLDPVCKIPELVNPSLPAGNPAPSTRRMARRLEAAFENLPPDAIQFMSDHRTEASSSKVRQTESDSSRREPARGPHTLANQALAERGIHPWQFN